MRIRMIKLLAITLCILFSVVFVGNALAENTCTDSDDDGFCDIDDNCPCTYNPEQEDGDGDSCGDACDGRPDDPNWVSVYGSITYEGNPLCTMALANGQYMFTCGENNGLYDLDVPLDENGEITLYGFCSGLAPYGAVLTPDQALCHDIAMARASVDSPEMSITVQTDPGTANPNWVRISGSATYEGTPLCTMVLANGQHMFSCGDDLGIYDLEVPLDENGEITLYVFCSGRAPYKQTITPDNFGDSTTLRDLPDHYYLSEDGSQLMRGKVTRDGFYNIDTLEDIFLTFASDNWFDDVQSATDIDTRVEATLAYQDQVMEGVGVQFKGDTSERMAGDRKSFDIKLDYTVEGQDIDGYDLLNLNNTFEDPSYMREIFYLYQSRSHTTGADGNFVNLYINGEFYGLYANVQQLDKDFLEEWYISDEGTNWRAAVGQRSGGNFNDGTTALNYLGESPSLYEDAYELKSTSSDDPYAYLVDVTRALDEVTPETVDDLNDIMDVDGALWFLAYEILFGDDDGYISKGAMDYMVYYDIVTDRLLPYQYDGNTVMKPSNDYRIFYRDDNEDFPLAYKLFDIPELRQRYLAHVRTILLEKFDETSTNEILDYFHILIDEGVKNDPHPHTGITYEGLPEAIDELREFISDRYSLLSNHDEVCLQGPAITNVYHMVDGVSMISPDFDQNVTISASVNHESGLKTVYTYYSIGTMGGFDRLEMFDDGEHNDVAANDGIYGVALPTQPEGTWVRYYIEAIADNNAGGFGTISYSPVGAEHDVYLYRVNLEMLEDSPVRINEIMASNTTTIADNFGEYDDWAELYNTTDQQVSLDGYFLTDNSGNLDKWALPAVTLEPYGFITFWIDDDEEQGNDHAPFKLNATGEELVLVNSIGEIADALIFGPQETDISYGRYPDGTGDFSQQIPTYGAPNSIETP